MRHALSLAQVLIVPACLAAACGGSSGASTPGAPTVTGTRALSGVVGYDEDGDGTLAPAETVRFAGAVVRAGGSTATTDAAGRFALENAPAAATAVTVEPATLPPYFELPATTAAVGATDVVLGLRLPIGSNRPHVYIAFGDSISVGVGSRGEGYRGPLERRLRAHWGRADVLNEGISGTPSDDGPPRLRGVLFATRPAYTLLHYGTNDWQRECRQGQCRTLDNLREMVRLARADDSLPVLATLLPSNPPNGDPTTDARTAWLEQTNNDIRALARETGVPLADTYAAFKADRDPSRLFADFLHPNERGYELMADELFRAITAARASHAAAARPTASTSGTAAVRGSRTTRAR